MVVQSTWKAADGKDIEHAIIWAPVDEKESDDVEDQVQAENCLLLVAPSAGSPEYPTVPACQLILSCPPPVQIKHLSVLSEARVLEIYGHHGEYMQTVRNDLLEEVDDMAVFRGDVILDRPLNICSIKFACLQSKNEMWLYGVKIKTVRRLETPQIPFNLQFAEMEQKIGAMSLTPNNNASFAELLKMSNMIKERSSLQSPLEFNSQKQPLNPIASSSENMMGQFGAFLAQAKSQSPSSNSENLNSKSISLQSASSQTDDLPPGSLEIIQNHIDTKIQELSTELLEKIEKRFEEFDKGIWEKIDKRFNELDVKLICKLDEIESFVKPQGVIPKT